MSRYPVEMVPAKVLADVEDAIEKTSAEGAEGCGCEISDARVRLCQYHNGMCDGWWMREGAL